MAVPPLPSWPLPRAPLTSLALLEDKKGAHDHVLLPPSFSLVAETLTLNATMAET